MRYRRFQTIILTFAMAALVQGHAALAGEDSLLRQPDLYDLESDSDSDSPAAVANDGEPEVVRERYPDGKVKIERQVTVDAEGNYINHGPWKMLNSGGETVAEGQFDMGQRIGSWSRWHGRKDAPLLGQFPINNFKPPFHSQAIFVNNQMDGEWLVVDSAQRKCFQITFSNGKRNGTMTTWFPNGDVYRQATYDQGVPVGDILERDRPSGELKTVATYIEGRKLVTKTAHHERNKEKKSEEQFLAATTVEQSPDDYWTLKLAEYAAEGEDLLHGPSKTWYENGKSQHDGAYHYGKRTGTFTYYYDNGQVASTGEYQDDQAVDVWVWWHRNGQKATVGEYDDGKLTGEWRWWKEDGKLATRKTYDGTGQAAADRDDPVETSQLPSLKPVR